MKNNPNLPDLKRCQVESRSYNAFTLGKPAFKRCSNKATWIAEEKKGSSGSRKSSMSLCDKCLPIAKEKFGNFVKYVKIKSQKQESLSSLRRRLRRYEKVLSDVLSHLTDPFLNDSVSSKDRRIVAAVRKALK